MMGLKRKDVEETVKEHRADELSCMYNMIIDKKSRDKGGRSNAASTNGIGPIFSLIKAFLTSTTRRLARRSELRGRSRRIGRKSGRRTAPGCIQWASGQRAASPRKSCAPRREWAAKVRYDPSIHAALHPHFAFSFTFISSFLQRDPKIDIVSERIRVLH
jgi:hypothetical protein